MGIKVLDITTNEFETEVESNYRIVVYLASQLPKDFKNLIMGPFLNSLRYGNDLFKLIDKDSYYSSYAKYIELLLQRPNTRLKIAVLSDETVLGWCMFENTVVHYIWVKEHQRRQGIARSLLPREFDTITHITNKGINIWVNKFPEVRFDPWA